MPTTAAGQRDLELLATFLGGTFETVKQAAGAGDSSHVMLHHARIWAERPRERWIYAEYQRHGESQPFRQRIYRLVEDRGAIVGTTFDLPAPASQFAGEWRKPVPFATLEPSQLKERAGCRLRFIRQGEIPAYNGGTEGRACPGDPPAYAREAPEFFVTSSSIRHWIPVLDPAGQPLSGLPGPWEFRKIDEKMR